MPDFERVFHLMRLEISKDNPEEVAREQGYWKGLRRGRIELLIFMVLQIVVVSVYFLYSK